jgi:hypothetical protein
MRGSVRANRNIHVLFCDRSLTDGTYRDILAITRLLNRNVLLGTGQFPRVSRFLWFQPKDGLRAINPLRICPLLGSLFHIISTVNRHHSIDRNGRGLLA